MTEAEWLESVHAIAMLEYLKGKTVATARKLCLFTCASLRRLFPDQAPVLECIEEAERFVEVTATIEERRAALAKFEAIQNIRTPIVTLSSLRLNLIRHSFTMPITGYGADMDWWHHANVAAMRSKEEPEDTLNRASLIRDIFPTPLVRRMPRIPPAWRRNEGTIAQLAQALYDERAFERMPILGDALEEAGCTNASMLDHCRQPGEHVRGCWVVDLILGKK